MDGGKHEIGGKQTVITDYIRYSQHTICLVGDATTNITITFIICSDGFGAKGKTACFIT